MYSPSQSSNSSILVELYKYNPSSIIELYELDLTALQSYYTSKGAPITTLIYRFYNGYNNKITSVVWDGNTYAALPIQMEGIQVSSAGEIARPTITIANHNLDFTQLNKAYANLIGATIRRIRTFVKFLDSVNFSQINLLTNTEAFDTWTQDVDANTTVTANATTAPNGTLTADKLFEATTTASNHGVTKTFTVTGNNVNVCCSVHLKASERTSSTLRFINKAGTTNAATFNLSSGTVSSTTVGTVLSTGIQPMGNGWYRCWMVCSSGTGATTPQIQIYTDNDTNPSTISYAGTVNSGIFVWGAQAEVITNPTLTPTVYQAVGSTAGNPTADPNARFPNDEYVIDRLSEEVPGQVTYELAPAWDVEGVQLPRRQIVANVCPWVYKADPCNWAYNGSTTVSYTSGTSVATTTIAATISGTTMTVTSASGTIRKRMFLTGGTVIAGTRIVEQLTGTTGGVGTYTVSRSQTATGITTATPVGTQQDVASKATSGKGSGVRFTITVTAAAASYSTATITVKNPGNNYSAGDTITIDGTYLGGVTSTNDLVVTVGQIITGQYFDANDLIVSTAAEDQCGKRLTSCKIRFGSRALPFGGFPSAGLYGKPI